MLLTHIHQHETTVCKCDKITMCLVDKVTKQNIIPISTVYWFVHDVWIFIYLINTAHCYTLHCISLTGTKIYINFIIKLDLYDYYKLYPSYYWVFFYEIESNGKLDLPTHQMNLTSGCLIKLILWDFLSTQVHTDIYLIYV